MKAIEFINLRLNVGERIILNGTTDCFFGGYKSFDGVHPDLSYALYPVFYAVGKNGQMVRRSPFGVLRTTYLPLCDVQSVTRINNYVDLGLPSGRLWASENAIADGKTHFTYADALHTFGKRLPAKDDWAELFANCKKEWYGERKGYLLTGPNGNSIFLPAAGFLYGQNSNDGITGHYWSSTPHGTTLAHRVRFSKTAVFNRGCSPQAYGNSVRLCRAAA